MNKTKERKKSFKGSGQVRDTLDIMQSNEINVLKGDEPVSI